MSVLLFTRYKGGSFKPRPYVYSDHQLLPMEIEGRPVGKAIYIDGEGNERKVEGNTALAVIYQLKIIINQREIQLNA